MNINCPRDPLTCKCDYHLGFDARLNEAFGEKPKPRFHLPEPHVPPIRRLGVIEDVYTSDGQMIASVKFATAAQTARVQESLADSARRICAAKPAPRPSHWRAAARIALGFAMVATGAGCMYWEGQHQPLPGVGFAVGMGLIVGAAFLLNRSQIDA